MSLAFLNKKSWHTATLRNAERVWKAEQKQKAEVKKMEQLRKEKEEERQIEELRRLQAASGLNVKTHGERVDWMYEGVHAQGPTSEEYLLGKTYEQNLGGEEDELLKLEKKEAVGSIYLNSKVNEEMEEKARMREDPLVDILRREQISRIKLMKNPVEMAKIEKKAKTMMKLNKLRKKKAKKEKKKRKKEKKRAKKMRRENGEEEAIQQQEPEDQPNEDSERDEVDALPAPMRKKYGLILNPNASPPPVRARNRDKTDGDPPKDQNRDDDREDREKDRGRVRGRRRYNDRRRGRDSRSPVRNRRRGRDRSGSRDRDRSRSRGRNRDRRNRGRDSSRDRRRDRNNRANDDSEEDRPKRRLTREERLAKLREMEEDAEAHEDAKLDRVRKAKAKAQKEHKDDNVSRAVNAETNSASFIRKMNNTIYSGKESLQERLKKNQHYRQKGGEALSAESFMRR